MINFNMTMLDVPTNTRFTMSFIYNDETYNSSYMMSGLYLGSTKIDYSILKRVLYKLNEELRKIIPKDTIRIYEEQFNWLLKFYDTN